MNKNDAPFFELPNNVNAMPIKPMFYGNEREPHATNNAAKKVNAAKVMEQVLEAK